MRHPFRSLTAVVWIAGGAVLATAVGLQAAPAFADGEATGRIRLLTRSLVADYGVKRPGSDTQPLAVFDFACPEALAKQRVGYAIAELLKSELISATRFTLVERADLERLLKEQALQQTGVTDANTSVQLGKVVGAKLAISGNVDKIGGVYQVSARLADVATGEVLAIATQELPAKVFEQEAGRYLELVPEEEAIGIFCAIGMSGSGSFTHSAVRVGTSASYDVASADFKPPYPFLGLRYQPARWLMLELALTPSSSKETIKTKLTDSDPSINVSTDTSRGDLSGLAFDVTGHWIRPLRWSTRAMVGAGVSIISFTKNLGESQEGGPSFGPPGGGSDTRLHLVMKRPFLFVRPVLEAGLEWKPQPRFGWSVRGILYPLPATAHVGLESPNNQGGTDSIDGELASFKLPTAAAFTSVALYF